MKMIDLKPSAVLEFNKYISDEFAREYFADSFDNWTNSESAYTTDNNAYKTVIKRNAFVINAEVKKAQLLKMDFTKKTTSTTAAVTLENAATDKTQSGTVSDTRTQIDGEFTQSQRQYPDGYTGTTDEAYLRAQTHDSEFTKADTAETETGSTEQATTARDETQSGSGETIELDTAAALAMIETYSTVFVLIEKCVFELVAIDIEGVF